MKLLVFLIITTFLAILSCEPRTKLAPVVANCPLLLPVENYSQTVIFEMDVHSDPEIKTCILKNYHSERSVLLLNVYGPDKDFRAHTTSDYPNVIVLTKYLTTKLIDSFMLQFFININSWSLLYIIVTGDSKFKCKNGTMNTNDFILLDQTMNTLWQRFQIMRVGVVFPFACEQKMVIYNGKRPSSRNLYDRPIKLMNATNSKDLSVAIKESGEGLAVGYPMQGSLFERYPTSIKDCNNLHYYAPFNFNLTHGYCGLDGMVMHDLLAHFKFNLSFIENVNCGTYGFAVPGNISGSLGCITREELDISFNSRFMTLYLNEHVHYVHYVTTDSLCALVKKTDVVPLWRGVFNLYSLPLWMMYIALIVVIGGIMWATARINRTITGQKTMTLGYYLYNSVVMMMTGYSPMKTKTLIMIRSMCLTGSILFLAVYQGHINRVFTTLKRFEQIKTLEQLYSSGVTLYTSPAIWELTKQVRNTTDKLQEDFFNRSHLILSEGTGIPLEQKSATTLDRKSDAEMKILEQYSDNDGTPLIDIVNECFSSYYVSYIARAGFPFFEGIQIFTERLKEAGLPTMYYKWTQQMLNIPNATPQSQSEPRPFSKVKLQDQRVAFAILFIGTIVSVIVFAAELWKGRRQHLKLYNRRS